MNIIKQNKLIKKHPIALKFCGNIETDYMKENAKYPIEQRGIECGNGWYKIVDDYLSDIDKLIDKYCIEIYVTQIKNKCGEFTLYWDYDTTFKDVDDKLIKKKKELDEKYRELSKKICEFCEE